MHGINTNNVGKSGKTGKSVDSSELLIRKKRNVHIQVHNSKIGTDYDKRNRYDQGSSRISLMNVQRGLDSYFANNTVVIISGSFRFQGTYDRYTLDIPALTAAFAKNFGVPVSSVTLKVYPGSVIIEYTITATVSQAQVISEKVAYGTAFQNFKSNLLDEISGYYIGGLFLTPGTPVSSITLQQDFLPGKLVTTFVGNGTSNRSGAPINGTGTDARLTYPSALAVDSNDNLYIYDNFSSITKATPEGVTSTVGVASGSLGSASRPFYSVEMKGVLAVDTVNGYVYDAWNNYFMDIERFKISDGSVSDLWTIGKSTRIGSCAGLALSANKRYLYFSHIFDCQIKVIDLLNQSVSTIAGINRSSGFVDGNALTTAKFNAPTGLALDSINNILYVADTNNHAIRAINLTTNSVSTIAGSGTVGWTDNLGSIAQFNGPTNLAYNSNIPGFLFVSDTGNFAIRQIQLSTKNVQTLAGTGVQGSEDGAGVLASFHSPYGLALSDSGILYIADAGNYKIRQMYITYIPPPQDVTILGNSGFPSMLGITANNTDVYVTDYNNNKLCRVDINGNALIVAGSTQGFANGTGFNVKFNTPGGICNDGYYLYLCDIYNYCIRRVNMYTYEVDVIAGIPGQRGIAFGIGSASKFVEITSICYDGVKYLYVADAGAQSICRVDIEPPYSVIKIAGSGGVGATDSNGSSSTFNYIWGIAYDGSRYLYVCDGGNSLIRRIDTQSPYSVITVGGQKSGNAGISGYVEGTLSSSKFAGPQGLAYNYDNNCLYIADSGNSVIRKIDIANSYRTSLVAGKVGVFSTQNGSLLTCSFNRPSTCAFDSAGNLLVAEWGLPGYIRKVINLP